MYIVDGILVSQEVLDTYFACDLSQCKGACCWEGDYGAPLEVGELDRITEALPTIMPMLSQESQDIIGQEGVGPYHPVYGSHVTPLRGDGGCVYLTTDESGVARCSFEVAFEKGDSSWPKPMSCHLYPIRVHKNDESEWEALNYDVWSICSAACPNGQKLEMPLFRFAKQALIRKYGDEFYHQLEALYEEYGKK
ncbi:MAG: DUF3109 family protein [Bacteroidota bacterium]